MSKLGTTHLLRRIPWMSVVMIPLAWVIWFAAPTLSHEDTVFFAMGLAVLFFLTGLVTLYLHAIWYRLWCLDQKNR